MGAVQLVVVGVVGLGLWVLWRRHRYPGGWAFAFSLKHESDRETLANARNKAREMSRRAAQAESAALANLTSAQAAYERRLRELDQLIARLRNPGTGERLGGLGELVLFEHILVVTSETGTRSIWLAGLDARFDTGRANHSIYLTDVTGRVHRAKYPHLPSPADDQQRFNEDAVRDFAVAIQNAVADENSFRARIPRQLTQAEAKLEEARADTRTQEAAREELTRVRQLNRQDPHRKVADSELEGALQGWETLTGRIPPK
jgi:outer membrane translocation and assembly module TamA